MTNNQLCNLVGGAGCAASALGLGLLFFGAGAGLWITLAGICLAGLSLVNYN